MAKTDSCDKFLLDLVCRRLERKALGALMELAGVFGFGFGFGFGRLSFGFGRLLRAQFGGGIIFLGLVRSCFTWDSRTCSKCCFERVVFAIGVFVKAGDWR